MGGLWGLGQPLAHVAELERNSGPQISPFPWFLAQGGYNWELQIENISGQV